MKQHTEDYKETAVKYYLEFIIFYTNINLLEND